MAKSKTPRKTQGDTWGLGKRLWEKTTPSGWLEILRKADPSRKWTLNGQVITTHCPYHDEQTPSFKLTISKKLGKCFGCGKSVTDIAQLIAKIRGCSYEGALIFLNDELHFEKDFLEKDMGKLVEIHALEDMKKAAAVAFTKVVDEYVRDHPSHLDYMKVAATYLEKARNVPLHMLSNLPVSIFPKPEHAKKYMPEDMHEAYDKYFAAVNKDYHWGSVLFWYNDSPSTISRFKLRNKARDLRTVLSGVSDVSQLDPKAARSLFSKDFTVVADPVERPMGFFGLHHYSRLLSDHNTAAVVTEGEFDALSVMVGQMRNGSTLDFPILATGGMGSTNFELLKDSWIRTVYAVPDTPGDKRGDQVAYGWLCSTGKVNNSVKDESLNFKIFTWPNRLTNGAGDLDEAVQVHGFDEVRKHIWVDKDDTYLNKGDWVTQKCTADLDALDEECNRRAKELDGKDNALLNLNDERRHSQRDILAKWIKAVPDKLDRSMFVNLFSTNYDLNLTSVDDVYASLYNVDTVDGAAEAVAKALFDIVSIPYYTLRNGKMFFMVYSKVTEETLEAPFTNDNAIEHAISKFVSGDMTDWMKAVLHNAETTTPKAEDIEKFSCATAIRAEETKRCGIVMRKVVTSNIHKAKDVATLHEIGQGIHYKDLPDNDNVVYLVNGMKVFKGVLHPASGAPIEWERVHDLRDGKYWFKCARNSEWSSTVQDVQDLNFGMQVDLAKVYQQVAAVLDGWEFQDHDIMKPYIASWIISLPIQLAVDRVTTTCITGESTSGKTSFMQGLLGGSKSANSRIPSILEPAKVVTDATEAYLNQTFHRTSMFVGVDEAETDDSAEHNKRMKNIIRLLYSSSTGGGDIGRGVSDFSGSVEMQYKCPTLLAAIHLPTNETFLTRTTILYTKKNYKWKDIGDYINEVLKTPRALTELRKSITTGLLSRLDEVRSLSDELVAKTRLEETDPPTTDRFRESVAVALAVYAMSGTEEDPHDPIKLYHDIVKANRSRLEIILAADMKHPLLNTILYTKCVQGYKVEGGTIEYMSARDLLIEGSRDHINTLNNASVGVYCLPEKGWLIFYWRQLKATVLANNITYGDLEEGALRESISKNKYLINDISDADHEYIMEKIRLVDAKMKAAYSVISMKYIMDSDYARTIAGSHQKDEPEDVDIDTDTIDM